MPPSDSVELEQLRAKVRSQSLVVISLTIVTLATAAALAAALAGFFTKAEGSSEDDERPPVIVTSGGSIKLYAQEKFDSQGNSTGHGSFDQYPDSKVLIHKHSKTGPSHFEVFVVFAQCTRQGKPIGDRLFKTGNVTMTYPYKDAQGDQTGQLVADIVNDGGGSGNFLRFDTKGVPYTTKSAWELNLTDDPNAALTTALIAQGGADKDVTCTFENVKAASLTFFQKK